MSKTLIINSEKVEQKTRRIAFEILENNFDEQEIIIVGIKKRGFKFATNLVEFLKKNTEIKITLNSISVNKENVFDDNAISYSCELKNLKGKSVVVVDDVLNSGKTLMYVVRYLLNEDVVKLSTAVLVDRRHRNYPIKADFAGLTLSTTIQEHISVEFRDSDAEVFLV